MLPLSRKKQVHVNNILCMDNKQVHIASLLVKLFNDNYTTEELHELQHLFHAAEAQGDVDRWMVALWEAAGKQQDSCTIDASEMLKKLNEKIRLSKPVYPATKDKLLHHIRSTMRYAAVSLFAMAFSWLWFGKEKQPENQKSDTGNFIGVSEVAVTYGSKSRIVLPDSSVVYLNSGSRLSYPSVFDSERNVTLTGEAYFIVRSDTLHPFLVHTADVSVKALGTEFNVKAYPEEGNVETVLVRGLVEIFKKGQVKPIIELKPGEKASYVKAAPSVQPAAQTPTNTTIKESPRMIVDIETKPDATIGWVKNQLVFDAEPFEEIVVRLERWFNVEVDIRNVALHKTRMTGRYDTENIEQVMHSLQMVIPFTYKIEKNKIIIR